MARISLTESGVKITGTLTVTGDVLSGASNPATEISAMNHVHVGGTESDGNTGAPVVGT